MKLQTLVMAVNDKDRKRIPDLGPEVWMQLDITLKKINSTRLQTQ